MPSKETAKQSALYGVLAAIPLFMIWLNLGWSIILYGAELSYAFQNVNKHKLSSPARWQDNVPHTATEGRYNRQRVEG